MCPAGKENALLVVLYLCICLFFHSVFDSLKGMSIAELI